jgi:3-oxoadipate enol-lactonase
MELVRPGGASIHFEIEGSATAPALLLLHALGADMTMWEPQLARWRSHYRVIRCEVRGHGGSSPAGVPELTSGLLAEDALAVLDAANVPRAHWCGISMGGMSAMWAAAHHPERVARLVLANTSAHMPPRTLWQSRIDIVRRDGIAALVPGILERWFTPQFRKAAPAQLQRVQSMLLRVDPASYAAACAAIRDMDQRPTLPRIRAQTLVLCADQDPSTPLPHSETLCAAIPGSRFELLHASHLSNVEAPDAFEAAVSRFLSGP